LILAGASFYSNDDVVEILNNIAAQLKRDRRALKFEVPGQGSFTRREADSSWAGRLMRGALDYYQVLDIPGLQIVPDEAHWTIDVPDMRAPWNATDEPVWRWLNEPWTFPVSEKAVAATDLAALRGDRITEARRWESDEWESSPEMDRTSRKTTYGLSLLVASWQWTTPLFRLCTWRSVKDCGATQTRTQSGINGAIGNSKRKMMWQEQTSRARFLSRLPVGVPWRLCDS
ncbi:MAG: hypothetical protein ACREAC_00245, partial [Blastocatellia bacterium]